MHDDRMITRRTYTKPEVNGWGFVSLCCSFLCSVFVNCVCRCLFSFILRAFSVSTDLQRLSVSWYLLPLQCSKNTSIIEGPGGSMSQVVELPNIHTSLPPIQRGFAPGFVNYKKCALDSQPQVIKFTSCLPKVGGSLRVLRLLPPIIRSKQTFSLQTSACIRGAYTTDNILFRCSLIHQIIIIQCALRVSRIICARYAHRQKIKKQNYSKVFWGKQRNNLKQVSQN